MDKELLYSLIKGDDKRAKLSDYYPIIYAYFNEDYIFDLTNQNIVSLNILTNLIINGSYGTKIVTEFFTMIRTTKELHGIWLKT